MEPRITVIIPSYNRAHLLEKTVPTYMQEGVKEIILVDDCSKDNTPEVVRKLQQQMPQLKYIRQSRNMRQPVAKIEVWRKYRRNGCISVMTIV